jgi:hypothetical protein
LLHFPYISWHRLFIVASRFLDAKVWFPSFIYFCQFEFPWLPVYEYHVVLDCTAMYQFPSCLLTRVFLYHIFLIFLHHSCSLLLTYASFWLTGMFKFVNTFSNWRSWFISKIYIVSCFGHLPWLLILMSKQKFCSPSITATP